MLNLTIDLVIMGLAMREQEGIETIHILRRARPQLKIIALSGIFAGPLLHVAEQFGADASLATPIQPGELLHTVARLTSGLGIRLPEN